MNRTTNAVSILWGNFKGGGILMLLYTNNSSDNRGFLLTTEKFLPLFPEPLVMKTPQVSVITLADGRWVLVEEREPSELWLCLISPLASILFCLKAQAG